MKHRTTPRVHSIKGLFLSIPFFIFCQAAFGQEIIKKKEAPAQPVTITPKEQKISVVKSEKVVSGNTSRNRNFEGTREKVSISAPAPARVLTPDADENATKTLPVPETEPK